MTHSHALISNVAHRNKSCRMSHAEVSFEACAILLIVMRDITRLHSADGPGSNV